MCFLQGIFLMYIFCTVHTRASPLLIFSNVDEISCLNLETEQNYTVQSGMKSATSLDYHYNKGLIFWTDTSKRHIAVFKTDTKQHLSRDVITSRIGKSYGLAVDWLNDNLFWTDQTYKSVQVSDLAGKYRKTLVSLLVDKPTGIAVHPQDGILFFADMGSYPRIERCAFDGTDRKVIVDTNIQTPVCLTIDKRTKRVYWSDLTRKEIWSVKFDGSSIRLVIRSKKYLTAPYGVELFNNRVYWTNEGSQVIYHTETYGSFEVKKAFSSSVDRPLNLKLYQDIAQMNFDTTPCSDVAKGGCSQLCLMYNHQDYTCACSDGYKLGKDGKSCTYNGKNVKLLYVESKKISSIDIETLEKKTIASSLSGNLGIDYHFSENLVIWSDSENIYSSLLNSEEEISEGLEPYTVLDSYNPSSIAVDWVNDNIFWTDSEDSQIHICSLYGHNPASLTNDLTDPTALSLHPNDGIMVYVERTSKNKIYRSWMDGSNRKMIIEESLSSVGGVTIDTQSNRVFWSDYKTPNTIKSATLEGKDIQTPIKFTIKSSPMPYGISVYKDKVFWSNYRDNSVYTSHKYTGEPMESFLTNLKDPLNLIIASKDNQQQGTSRCLLAKCQHLCVHVPITPDVPNGYRCLCKDGYYLEEEQYCVKKVPGKIMKGEL